MHRLSNLMPAAVLLLAAGAFAQPVSDLFTEWTADPVNAHLPDFGAAGYAHGEQHPPWLTAQHLPVLYASDFGALPDDGWDDRDALQRAIDAAGEAGGGIVQLAAGRYLVNSDGGGYPLWIRHDHVVLRGVGDGPDGTLIYGASKYGWYFAEWTLPALLHVAAPELKGVALSYGEWNGKEGTQDWYSGGWENNAIHPPASALLANGTLDAERGTNTLRVDDPGSFHVGQSVIVMQEDKLAMQNLMLPWDYSWFYNDNDSGWPNRENIILQGMTVAAVEGDTIRFVERFVWDFFTQWGIRVYPYNSIDGVGIEDLRIEVVITPRDDRWDANGKAIHMSYARNSWVRGVTGLNVQSTLNITSLNTQADVVRHSGEPFHDSIKFLGAFNSLMRDAEIDAFYIDGNGDIVNVDHGFAVQHQAALNVYLDPVMPENCSVDIHSGDPISNLYDRILGGRHSESGGGAAQLQGQAYHTFWNWTVQTTDKVPYNFPVWGGSQTSPYTAWNMQLVKPIVSGLQADPLFPTPISVQYAESHDFGTGYFNNNKVIAEHIGTMVSPDSLYLAQRDMRLQNTFGKTGPEEAIAISVDGPTRILAGVPVEFDLGGSTSAYPLQFEASIDGGRSFVAVSGSIATLTLSAVGPVDLVFRAISSAGGMMTRRFPVKVFDDGATVVPSRAAFPVQPRSFGQVEAGLLWNLLPLPDPSVSGDTTDLWVYGEQFGMTTRYKDDTLNFGGLLYTRLPDTGVDLEGADFRVVLAGSFKSSFPERPRIVARDLAGNWATYSQDLPVGTTTGSFTGSWQPLPDMFGVQTGAFDPGTVNAVGVAFVRLKVSINPGGFILRLDDFEISRAAPAASIPPDSSPALPVLVLGGTATGSVGEAIGWQLDGGPDAVGYRTESLPPGLHLDALTGALAGTPRVAGSHVVPVTVITAGGEQPPVDTTLEIAPMVAEQLGLGLAPASTVYVAGQPLALNVEGATGPVDFQVNGGSVGTSTGAPYELTWTPAGPGVYSLQASDGSLSSPVREIVVMPESPAPIGIALTSPADGTLYQPAPYDLDVNGTLSDPDGIVKEIHILCGTERVAVVAPSANWSTTVSRPVEYDQTVTALAVTIADQALFSVPVSYTVAPSLLPEIILTSPGQGEDLSYFDDIRFSGRATDPDGEISKVELWSGTHHVGSPTFDTKLGETTVTPDGAWIIKETTLLNSNYSIYAKATDSTGAWSVSELLPVTKSFRFSDDPVYGESANYSLPFQGGRWDFVVDDGDVRLHNLARFGFAYDHLNGLPGTTPENFVLTFRARHPNFHLPDNPQTLQMLVYFGANLQLHVNPGDVTLAKKEGPYVIDMAANPLPGITSDDWNEWEIRRVGEHITVRRDGAVLIDYTGADATGVGGMSIGNHRISGDDVYFDDVVVTTLDGSGDPVAVTPPMITLTQPASGLVKAPGSTVTIAGSASGALSEVEIFAGSESLGLATVNSGVFSFQTEPLAAGSYAFVAKGTGADEAAVSEVARVIIDSSGRLSNLLPTAMIDEPADGTTIANAAVVLLEGPVSDSDGSVESVILLVDGQRVAPAFLHDGLWKVVLPNLPAGAYDLAYEALDAEGARSAGVVSSLTLQQGSRGIEGGFNVFVPLPGTGFTGLYSEDFDALPSPLDPGVSNNAIAGPFLNGVTLPGWSAVYTNGAGGDIRLNDGSGSTSSSSISSVTAWSFGPADSGDRAIGPTRVNSDRRYVGVGLRNDTGATIGEVVVTYTGEQWRSSSTSSSARLTFNYCTASVNLLAGTWQDAGGSLDFNLPVKDASGAVDGRLPANRQLLTATLTNLALPPGETLWLRWSPDNLSNNFNLAGVNDLTVTIPGYNPAPTFDEWAADPETGLPADQRGPLDDPNRNGLSNIFEFIMAADPANHHSEQLMRPLRENGEFVLRFNVRNNLPADVSYVIEQADSPASGDWSTVPPENILFVSDEGTYSVLEVRSAIIPGDRIFYRMNASWSF